MERVFGCNFTWYNGWIYYWKWRSIFGCLIIDASTCIPTWISKSFIFPAGMLLGAPLGLWFGSEVVKYWCSCHHLVDLFKAIYGKVDISSALISVANYTGV